MNHVSSDILKQISSFDTVKEAWFSLEKKFSSRSKGRIIQLRQELLKMRKGNHNVTNYILKFKELVDQMQSARYALAEDDKILYLVSGLDRDFESIVSTISSKMQSERVTLDDTVSLMLSHKSWLES